MGKRHAEKSGKRVSSCSFADNVAAASIAAHDASLASLPEAVRSRLADRHGTTCHDGRQTVLAAIVALDTAVDGEGSDVGGVPSLRVVALGAGTKFMCGRGIAEDEGIGEKVRDSHAEVLARRALKRFLYAQIKVAAARATRRADDEEAMRTSRPREGKRRKEEDASSSGADPTSWCVLEEELNGRSGEGRWRLRPSVTLHLYTSSTPCGNATVKRWAKGAKERFRDGLGPVEMPAGGHDHGKVSFGAVREGQLAFMYKRDPDEGDAEVDGGEGSAVERERSVPGADLVVPPGSSTTGRVLTCSDKLAVWSCVGLQGSLLLSPALLSRPVYLSSVTVGRKFNHAVLCRALCCRLHRFVSPQATERNPKQTAAAFALKHPTVMCTAMPFDLRAYSEGEGARFDAAEALVWWAEEEDGETGGGEAGHGCVEEGGCARRVLRGHCEVINGRTGAGVDLAKAREGGPGEGETRLEPSGGGEGDETPEPEPIVVSGVSRAALLRVHRAVLGESTGVARRGGEEDIAECASGSESYEALKAAASAASGYAAAKRVALSQAGIWTLSKPHRSVLQSLHGGK